MTLAEGKGWENMWSNSDELHLHPLNDLVEHTMAEDCVCGPGLKIIPRSDLVPPEPDAHHYIHHALDGRE